MKKKSLIVTVVKMRYSDWASEGTAHLEEAVTIPRCDGAGSGIDRYFIEELIRVQRLVAQQKIKIAVINIGSRSTADRDHSARSAAILGRGVRGSSSK